MKTQNRTLLILDDEPETLKGYEEFLRPSAAPTRKSSRGQPSANQSARGEPEEYRLLLARTGEEALELVQAELKEGRHVAAGFFDVKLEGGMDGLSAIRAIKELDKDIHCTVVTAYHDRSVEEIGTLFGEEFKDQWDYLNKPFNQGEIVQKARQMIAAWNRRKELEAMQGQLIRSERMAGIAQVARGIGHEFGNILLRVIGKTDLALKETRVEKIHDHLKVVMSAAERAAVIVKNLQSFSRTEPVFKKAKMSEALEQAAALIGHELAKFSVTLEKKFRSDPDLKLDVGALSQVFLNLIINAIHAMPGGGKIVVTLEDQTVEGRPGLAARVKDTGSGIPPELQEKIFEFAFTTKGGAGSGLGLSVSREIVQAHSGTLTVRSEPEQGTEMTVWIPR